MRQIILRQMMNMSNLKKEYKNILNQEYPLQKMKI